jgi:pimeloyl-ACP methyl ester carboxylesterase
LEVRPFGVIQRDGYRIEKMIYDSEPGILVPALLFVPRSEGRKPAIIYVHGDGKAAGAGPGGEVEQLVHRGFVVLTIDARGMGETRPLPNEDQSRETYRLFGHYDSAMTALLVGKTLVGMRAEDVSRGVDLLFSRPEVDRERVYGFGVGSGALVRLHAAVADSRIKQLALEGMLESYESVVTHRLHRDVFESVVRGVLKAYDLPDLVATLPPRSVWITHTRDPLGKRVGLAEVRKEYARSIDAFRAMGAPRAIHIEVTRPEEKLGPVFEESR